MKPLLLLKSVKKTFALDGIDIKVLHSINLSINKGEFLAIVGPSGSGKSTLMNIIGLLDRPSEGKYFLNGENVSTFDDNKLAHIRNTTIGFIFQTFNLLPKFSALKNVKLPLLYSKIKEGQRDKIAREKLIQVGLENRLDHHPNQLSGGQQQRVAIARALVNEPTIILADEPTGNLDSKSGESIEKILAQLNKQGHTLIVVTHDKTLAKKCNRIVEIKDGNIISDKKND